MINSINGYSNKNTSFNGSATFYCKNKDSLNQFLLKCLSFCSNAENNNIKILNCGNIATDKFNVKCADEYNSVLSAIAEKFANNNGYKLDFRA